MMSPTAIHPLKILAFVGAAFLVGGLVLAYASSPAWAAEITVNSKDDNLTEDDRCTLREAMTTANDHISINTGGQGPDCVTGSGADTITFASSLSGQTITLLSQLPDITDTAGLTIDGGSADITISGNKLVRVFFATGGELTLENLTVANGSADDGGAILNESRLTVTNSTFSGNSATSDGGAIENAPGTLTVTNSTFSGNSADRGGAIENAPGTLTVTNSTFSGNSANRGGAINNVDNLTVTNSTFSGNSAAGAGGAIFNEPGGTATLSNTIMANSPSGGNCINEATLTDDGYNLDDGTTCGFTSANNSQPSTNPLLGPLADNGGPTQTHALLTGSPAIDKGNSFGATTDQRGESRPHDFPDIANATGGDGSDIGSFELQSQPALSIDNVTVTEGNSGTTNATFTVSLSKASTQTVTVNYATADGTATAGTDYQPASGTLTFAQSTTSQTVTVLINGDTQNEPDETFFVNLSNPTNATISDTQGEGTITNDDTPPDTTAPKVKSTFPRGGGEVGPAANIRATFSEDMQSASVINAFKLFKKGSTNQIAAQVSYDAATDIATLNPTNNLRKGVTYKAVVSTVAKDVAGNRLDQSSSAGLQQKVWFFEID